MATHTDATHTDATQTVVTQPAPPKREYRGRPRLCISDEERARRRKEQCRVNYAKFYRKSQAKYYEAMKLKEAGLPYEIPKRYITHRASCLRYIQKRKNEKSSESNSVGSENK